MTKSDNTIKLSDIEPLDDPIFWVDIETTGLDYEKDEILEVAIVVTNGLWNVVDSYLQCFPMTYYGEKRLQDNDYVRNMHEQSGLLEDLRISKTRNAPAFINEGHEDLEWFVLSVLDRFEDGVKPIWAGSSVHFDRTFLEAIVSEEVVKKFSHRLIDASAVREVARREDSWRLDLLDQVKDEDAEHRADYDILASMKTLAISYGYSVPFLDNLPSDWDEVRSRTQAFSQDE